MNTSCEALKKGLASLLVTVCFSGLVICTAVPPVLAGPLPQPLEARLDTASYVFLGQITQIIDAPDVSASQGVRMGRATARLESAFKGAAPKTINFLLVSWVGADYQGAQILHAHHAGDAGIWLLADTDKEPQLMDWLPAERTSDVQRMLQMLAHRQWSQPVNGLQAWASVVRPDHHPNPVIIFAVRNVTSSPLYVPSHAQAGFIIATVVNQAGQSHDYALGVVGGGATTVFCEKLPPGETVYLHPDYSFIDLAWKQKLSPGQYSVTVTCRNQTEGGTTLGPGQTGPVAAWKGQLSAPPVQLLLPAPGSTSKRSQPR